MFDNGLVLFARYPTTGSVKRRLAATIGAEGAAEIYRAFLRDWSEGVAADPRWTTRWAFTPPEAPFARDFAGGRDAFPQRGADLGERMASAFAETLAIGHSAVAIVGADVPHLPAASIERAFGALASGIDLVLAPAADGGYGLIAARAVPDVFDGVAWGTSGVLAATLDRARRAGLTVELLAETYDVDRIEDAERLARDLESGVAGPLPATRAALRATLSQRFPRV